jgi:DnaK suppressor protein
MTKTKTAFSKADLKDIKEKLMRERELLVQKLKGNDLSIDDSETPDPVDLAVRNYSKNVMLAVSENESKQLTLIDEALLRIDDKEYGLCQNCEKDINQKRLGAIPWARYCLDCQELLERGLLDEE